MQENIFDRMKVAMLSVEANDLVTSSRIRSLFKNSGGPVASQVAEAAGALTECGLLQEVGADAGHVRLGRKACQYKKVARDGVIGNSVAEAERVRLGVSLELFP